MAAVTDLDLSADAVTLLEQLVNIESVSQNEQQIADAVEAALRPLAHLTVSRHGNTVVARTVARPRRSGSSSPATSTPCRSTRTCRRVATATLLRRPGHLRHEGRGRGDAQDRRDRAGAQPRHHLPVLRGRGDRERVQRPAPALAERPGPAAGRLRDPDGALGRRHRGGLPGHAARRRDRPGRARPLGALVEGRQRDPPRRRDPRPAQRLRGADARDRRAGVPRGPQRGLHQRRCRRQRAARRVHGPGQPQVRSRPQRGRGGGVREGVLRGLRGRRHRLGPRCAAGPRPAGGQGVRRGRRRRGQPEVRLDRRRPVLRPRRARRQLRPGRPDAGPQAGGVRAGRARPPLRVGAAHLARAAERLHLWHFPAPGAGKCPVSRVPSCVCRKRASTSRPDVVRLGTPERLAPW